MATLLTLLCPATALADGSAQSQHSAASSDQRAPLSLVVNGVPKADDVIVILRGNDVLVTPADLRAAQVPQPGAMFVDVKGVRYVSLTSLAPHVTYRLDIATFALNLQVVDASLLGHSTVNVGQPAQFAHAATADPSGFVTYSVSSASANLGDLATGFVQAGAGSAGGLFTASASYADGAAHRGLFAYQIASEQHLSQLTLGDEYASTGDLGANVVVGGFGASRHFEFQPGYAYFPSPGLRGTVLSPVTADLYVNGTFLRSVQLAPGAFDLSGIPVPPGAGVTQVVLHDAYGNTQTLGGTYYQARQLLGPGVTDYDYHVGFVRLNPFGSDDVYGPFAALGQYRIGLSNALTAGARFERTAGTLSGGPQVDLGLPLGHLSLEADASSSFGAGGRAFGAAYDYFSKRLSLSFSAQTQSASYSTASLLPAAARQRSSVNATFGLPISAFATLNISNTTTTFTGQPPGAQLLGSLSLKPRLRNVFFTLSAERDTGGSILGLTSPTGTATATRHWTFGVAATLSSGKNTTLTLGTTSAAGDGSTTLALTKSAPTGPGFGYQIQGTAAADRSAAAQVYYQTQFGDIQALTNSGTGTPSTTLTLTGGLVGFHQGVFFTRPVSGAYSLVNVPGFAGLPVYFNSQYAGSTDGRGAMVVPNLSPYYENQVQIDELANRLDLIEEASVETVRPKNLSGVVATFTIRHFHAYAGHIVVHRGGKSIVPVLGRLVLSRAGNDYSSDLGREGQFYVEDLEPGHFAATVTTTDGRTCAFHIDLPDDPRPVTSVGTRVCEATR